MTEQRPEGAPLRHRKTITVAVSLKLEKTHKTPGATLAGETLILDLSGALWLPEHRTLVVSDLHLEKGSAFAARSGQFLPPYDTRETLANLHEAVARLDPACVVCLGDSFHDAQGPARLDVADRALIAALQEGRDWIWISGNHDRAVQDGVGGRFADTLTVGGLMLRHEPADKPETARSRATSTRSARWRCAGARCGGAASSSTAPAW